MMWRTLLAAALLLPPMAYVAGTLVADDPAPDQRPALLLDENDRGPDDSERQVTIRPERDDRPAPGAPPSRPRDDDRNDDRNDDRDDDGDDRDDDGPVVVRPIPDEVDDDGDDDDDGGDDDSERDRDD